MKAQCGMTRWPWWGLALACALAGAPAPGQSTVVLVHLSTPNPDPFFPWDYLGMRLEAGLDQSYGVDFDADGAPEYTIYATSSGSRGSGIYSYDQNAVWAEPAGPLDLNSYAAPLPANVEVGPDLAPPAFTWSENKGGGSTYNACMAIGCLGYYGGLDWAYTGLRFVLGGQTHYGWVRVGVPTGGSVWLYDFAYETRPDTPILTPPLPDPPLSIIQLVQVSSNGFGLIWWAVAGRVYQVQHRDDAAASWSNSTDEITAKNACGLVFLYPAAGVTSRFYRVVQVR